MNKPLFSCRDQ